MDKRIESLSLIVEDILTKPNVDAQLIIKANKLALEDDYLYDLMVDWMKETNDYIKGEMFQEIINYTEEVIRRAGL